MERSRKTIQICRIVIFVKKLYDINVEQFVCLNEMGRQNEFGMCLCGLQKVERKYSAFHLAKKKNGVSALVYSIK